MSENDETSSGGSGMSGPDAGLSRTGRSADDFEPGDETASDYGDVAGVDRAEDEEAAG